MEIKVGDYTVFKDGTIVCLENEPIDFVFNKEIGFIIRVLFKKDSSGEENKIFAEAFKEKGAVLNFINFNNSLGVGNTQPIKVGTFNYKELYLNYRTYALSEGGKTFHYTWLLGKEVKDGK